MRRILFYSHDTYGLGNIRRTLAVAERMVTAHDDVTALVVSGSPMLHAFRLAPRLDYVKLPCLSRDERGRYGVRSLALGYDAAVRMRSRIIAAAVLEFAPDVIVVDKKPYGVDDELLEALRLSRGLPEPARLVLVLRDILDAAPVTRAIWERNGYFAAIEEHYDQVLVLGQSDVFDLVEEYAVPPACRPKFEYCGYLERPRGAEGAAALRARLAVDARRLVVVTTGGGADGFDIAAAALEALDAPGLTQIAAIVLTGPEMSTEHRRCLELRALHRAHTTVVEFSDDVMSHLEAADVVVSMAGYNTMCEVLTTGARSVVVPRVRPVEEQLLRAQCLRDAGRVTMVHPDAVSAATLREAIVTELGAVGARGRSPVDLSGLDRVDKHLYALAVDR